MFSNIVGHSDNGNVYRILSPKILDHDITRYSTQFLHSYDTKIEVLNRSVW